MTAAGSVLLSAVVSVIVATINGRSALRAQSVQAETALKVAAADDDTNAGRLALDVARDLRGRMEALEDWRTAMTDEWLPEHFAHDRLVEAQLLRLDPQAQLPTRPPVPPLRRRPRN